MSYFKKNSDNKDYPANKAEKPDPEIFMCVYAGPEYFSGRQDLQPMMEGVYAGPAMNGGRPFGIGMTIEHSGNAEAKQPTAFCPECGCGVREGDLFCNNCGATLPKKE